MKTLLRCLFAAGVGNMEALAATRQAFSRWHAVLDQVSDGSVSAPNRFEGHGGSRDRLLGSYGNDDPSTGARHRKSGQLLNFYIFFLILISAVLTVTDRHHPHMPKTTNPSKVAQVAEQKLAFCADVPSEVLTSLHYARLQDSRTLAGQIRYVLTKFARENPAPAGWEFRKE